MNIVIDLPPKPPRLDYTPISFRMNIGLVRYSDLHSFVMQFESAYLNAAKTDETTQVATIL